MNVIAVFDIGKTNKKLFLIDEQYRIVAEHSENFASVKDEDGEECEDLGVMTEWVRDSLAKVMASGEGEFKVRAVNFSAYGASLVYIGADGQAGGSVIQLSEGLSASVEAEFLCYLRWGGCPVQADGQSRVGQSQFGDAVVPDQV